MIHHPKRKVLFILQLPPPVHGASLMNEHIANSRLLRSNFKTKFINLQFSNSIQELEKFSIRKVFLTFYFAFLIVKSILRYKPDLIYFTLAPRGLAFYRDAFYVFLFKLFRKKVVYHLHGKGIRNRVQSGLLGKTFTRWMFRNVSVICLSRLLTEDIKNVFTSEPYIIPNGIETQLETDQVKGTLANVNGANYSEVPNILYLSNYIKSKGVLDLVEALKILKNQGVLFQARLVGAPADLSIESLKKYLHQSELLDRVEVVGPRYGQEKIAEFQNADIFVFPTFYSNEAFPLVNLEAMQFGLPVISTTEGGIPDMLVDNQTGFIVKTQQPKILAQKMAILLKDKDIRQAMGRKSYQRFTEHYTLAHFENNLVKAFNDMMTPLLRREHSSATRPIE